MTKMRNLVCCVCGENAGKFHQHWNRDTGYGVCRRCVEWVASRGSYGDEIESLYGKEGINYAAKTSA